MMSTAPDLRSLALNLDDETAARMLLLLALQDLGPTQGLTRNAFPGAVAQSLGLDADALASTARQHVQERLQLDLVKHGAGHV